MAATLSRQQAAQQHLTGRQKVAVLCMALGSEAAAKLTQRLTTDEAELISLEIARMDRVPPTVADSVLEEWVESMLAAGSLTEGGLEYARQILEKAYGAQKAAQVLKRIQTQLADTAGLHRLRTADPQQLGNMFRSEHPQTIALILAHLDAAHCAAVLKELPAALGSDVIYRMARMEKVSPDMLSLIERSLADTDLGTNQGLSSSGGPEAVASVLTLLSGSLEKELLEGLAAKDAELCDQVKNLMFVFEDLVTLDDRSLQRVLRDVETKSLALALKGASEELKVRITGAMTQRAATALADEIEVLGPVRMREVEAAQAAIIAQVRKLEAAGEVVVASGNDDPIIG